MNPNKFRHPLFLPVVLAALVSLCSVLFPGLDQRCAAQDFAPDITITSQDSLTSDPTAVLQTAPQAVSQPEPENGPQTLSQTASQAGSQTGSQTGAPAALPNAPATAPDHDPDRDVSWKRVLLNVAHDQKPIWLFPVSVAHGHHLVPTISVVALTVGLIVADRYDSGYFHRTQTFNGFDKVFSGRNTAYATWIFPLGFDFAGWLRNDKYGQRSAVLSGEAVLDSEIVTLAMKDIDRRWRPWEASTRGNGTYTDTWFQTHGDYLGGSGNFPSGHTIAAFSVATVFANRYPKYRWLAYGIAGAIGFSRISLQSHFPSDVFLGGVLGYSIAHFVVLQR